MIIPKPQPDEIVFGYRGRIKVLNLYKKNAELMADLRNKLGDPELVSAKSTARTLALASGVPIDQFVRLHSLLPLFRALPWDDIHVLHGDPSRPDLIDAFGSKPWAKTGVRFCAECIREDMDYWGFAYWRRIHQLPGIHACYKHGLQLASCTLGKIAFDDMPRMDSSIYYQLLIRPLNRRVKQHRPPWDV